MKKPKWLTWDKHYKGGPLSTLDIQILHFLWKWKVSPVRVLHQALAPNANPNTFNKRIKKLEQNELIQSQWDFSYGFHVWELGEFGFYVIRESLGGIKDHGFRSASLPHDKMVLAFQMGEWLWQGGNKPILISEQELLKYPKDTFSSLVPQSNDHRPDGYTILVKEDKKILYAIEVELYAKSTCRYHYLMRWYELQQSIKHVLWLIGEHFVMEQIIKAKALAKETSENYHLFVDINDYLQNGWESVVINEHSEKLKTLREIWRGPVGLETGENVGNEGTAKKIETFTDHRKFLAIQRS